MEEKKKFSDVKNTESKEEDESISKTTSKLESDEELLPCTICDKKIFTSMEGLKQHYTQYHPKEIIPYPKKSEKKRIIVGNTSTYIPEKFRHDNTTHKWMIYIRGPPDDPNLSFVKMLKVYIDESYEPNHIIELTSPPYHITKRGWGEFPYKVVVYFKNSEMNKPVEIIHHLKLDKTNSGKDVLSPEKHFDIELKHGRPSLKKPEKVESPKPEIKEIPKKKPTKPVVESLEPILSKKEMIIKENALKYPLISEKSMPYPVAKTEEQFLSWSLGKKKAIKKLRNNYLFDQISQHNIKKREITDFLRNHSIEKYSDSPEKKKRVEPQKERLYEMPIPNDYCRICGSQHYNVEELEECKKKNWDSIPYSIDEKIEKKSIQRKEFKVEKKKDYQKSLNEFLNVSKDEIEFIQSITKPMKISIQSNDEFEDKVTKMVFVKALDCFIDSLIKDSLDIYQSQKKEENELKVFVPIHVYTSIMTIKDYLFLRNTKE